MDNRLLSWIEEIRQYNGRLHLVGPRVLERLEEDVQECIALVNVLNEGFLADLGSGSGMPGIVYAVMRPESRVCLIERSELKCVFLRHVVSKMSLGNVEIIEADPLVRNAGRYPSAISRAFSPLGNLSKAASAILEKGGVFHYLATEKPRLDRDFILADQIAPVRSGSLKLFSFSFIRE